MNDQEMNKLFETLEDSKKIRYVLLNFHFDFFVYQFLILGMIMMGFGIISIILHQTAISIFFAIFMTVFIFLEYFAIISQKRFKERFLKIQTKNNYATFK